MDSARKAQLRELAAAATPGPWTWFSEAWPNHDALAWALGEVIRRGGLEISLVESRGEDGPPTTPSITGNGPRAKANAAFVAESRQAIPELLDEVERLEGERHHHRDEMREAQAGRLAVQEERASREREWHGRYEAQAAALCDLEAERDSLKARVGKLTEDLGRLEYLRTLDLDNMRLAEVRARKLEAVVMAAQELRASGYDGPFMGERIGPMFDALAALDATEVPPAPRECSACCAKLELLYRCTGCSDLVRPEEVQG